MSPALKKRYWAALPSKFKDLREKTDSDYLDRLSESDLAWLAEFNRIEYLEGDRRAAKRDIYSGNSKMAAVPLESLEGAQTEVADGEQPSYGDRRGRYKRKKLGASA